jgi:FkbM family methyltransferase
VRQVAVDKDESTPPEIAQQDQPFRHYSRRHRMISWISQNLFDHFSYTVRHGLIRGMKRRGGLGWVPQSFSRQFETKEEAFWRSLDLGGLVVYDVGAFHGILTLFFASRAAQVISYEPNSRNHARLMENIRLNGLNNVVVRKLGVGSSSGAGTLVFTPLMAGGGSLEQKTVEQLKRSNVAPVSQQIQITTLDQDIRDAGLPPPDFLKIDIEGWEIEALRGGSEILHSYHPALFLEMHGETMRDKQRKVAEIVEFLRETGYQNILHVETGTAITPANSAVAVEGHLYCPSDRARQTRFPAPDPS